MSTETRPIDDGSERWRTRGRTTIELRRNERGTWLATQRGVDADGRGSTPTAAVAAYCRALEDDGS